MNIVTRQEIIDGLRELCLNSGDHVMVHSSLKSFGYVDGGAVAVIDAVLSMLGTEGTMLVPTNVFRGSVTEYLRDQRTTDIRTAPATTGTIAETLRRSPEALRSIHPTHPVAAVGAKAAYLFSEHHLGDSPAGEKSPYGKLAQMDNGRILLLGVSNSNNTSIHTIEEYYTPYLLTDEVFDTEVTALDGQVYHVKVRGYCVNVPRNFTVLDEKLLNRGIMKTCKIGNATVTLIETAGMFELVKEEIERNPFILCKLCI